jgi:hypothetical protein
MTSNSSSSRIEYIGEIGNWFLVSSETGIIYAIRSSSRTILIGTVVDLQTLKPIRIRPTEILLSQAKIDYIRNECGVQMILLPESAVAIATMAIVNKQAEGESK